MRVLAALLVLAIAVPVAAQQKIAHVDSDAILERLPDYNSAKQEVERLTAQYQAEIDALKREAEGLEREFEARELLYTEQERTAAEAAIVAKRQEVDALRRRYFAPEGELFREQQQRLRPIQERVLEAVETVASDLSYDYVLDRAGEIVFLYARAQHDITERVLDELGVNTALGGGTR